MASVTTFSGYIAVVVSPLASEYPSQSARFVTRRHGKVEKKVASPADILRRASRVSSPQTSAELKDKFLSHCSQISAGDHMQIIGDPIGAVEVKVLTSQTHTYKLCRV